MNSNITIVTGLWDLGRGNLDGWAKRDFSYYKEKFFEMLRSDVNMVIWIPSELEYEVRLIRKPENTKIHIKEVEDFKVWFPFFNKLQEIRTNPSWYNSAGWLTESPQAKLEFYNPMMMCKMFMLNDSTIYDTFNTNYFFWVDGGLTSTVNVGYFLKDNVLDNLDYYCNINDDKFIYLSYPFEGGDEIHGFERNKMAEYCNTDFVKYVSRGGFFGGLKPMVNKINTLYYSVLSSTINAGYMGADECLFTILCHTNSEIIHRYELEGNGLCWPFFENLKSENLNTNNHNKTKVSLYVLTYNSPSQFKILCQSIKSYDINLLNKTKKYLINNSTDKEKSEEYKQLCREFDFEEIEKDNIGICGGRQFIAEHFNESESNYYLFFEDDMAFYDGSDNFCSNGFKRNIENFYNTVIDIMREESFDFLKLNFTEFFGDNTKQWAWHNVPADVRSNLFPDKPVKINNDYNYAPFQEFRNIKSKNGLPFANGNIYYCNWPQIVSREGNKKMFLETKWQRPYEQTWMSHIYQETIGGNIYPGILLATPTQHNRFDFYESSIRKEN